MKRYYADLATERESQLTTARANQTTGWTNERVTNWAPKVEFSPFRAFPSSNDVPVLLLNQPTDKRATGVFAIEAKKFHLLLHTIYLSEQFCPFKISNDV